MNQRALNSADHPSVADESIRDAEIEEQAYRIIDSHQHFHRRADRFVFECEDGVLSVWGCVPTFYLKQVLQNTLQLVPGVRTVENHVTVVSGHGLSSVSAK
jgi:osmotically-inducible protein OsmY